jgi:ribonuclease HI
MHNNKSHLVDHRMAQERMAEDARRKWRVATEAGKWLLSGGIPDWFLTITQNAGDGTERLSLSSVKKFLAEIEQDAHRAIGWVVAEVRGESGGRRHFHGLVWRVRELDRKRWWRVAFERFGRSQIVLYDDSLPGADYVGTNGLGDDGNLHFGGGLWDPGAARFRSLTEAAEVVAVAAHIRKKKRTELPMAHESVTPQALQVFVDGAGCRPDGAGSGYAFLIQTSGKQHVTWVDGLTNNAAEYRSLRYALLNVTGGSTLDVFSDSALVVNQFNGKWAVNDPKLKKLLGRIRGIIAERHLDVTLHWVSREENLARYLLERQGGREKR